MTNPYLSAVSSSWSNLQQNGTHTITSPIRMKPTYSSNPYCSSAMFKNHHMKRKRKTLSTTDLEREMSLPEPPQSRSALQLLFANREYQQKHDTLHLLCYKQQQPDENNRIRINNYDKNPSKSSHLNSQLSTSSSSWLQLSNTGGIYELVGEAGTGKTQLALNLCVQAALSTSVCKNHCTPRTIPEIRSIYVSLKGTAFVSRIVHRLNQMATGYAAAATTTMPSEFDSNHKNQHYRHHNVVPLSETVPARSDIMKRILTRACTNIDDLFDLLQNSLPSILQQQGGGRANAVTAQNDSNKDNDNKNRVRVLVIDSVADLFRGQLELGGGDSSNNESVKRASLLFQLSSILKRLSDVHNPLTIIVINQVTAKLPAPTTIGEASSSSCDSYDGYNRNAGGTNTNDCIPALGLSWAHCVNSSFFLSKDKGTHSVSLMQSSNYRAGLSTKFMIEMDGCYRI